MRRTKAASCFSRYDIRDTVGRFPKRNYSQDLHHGSVEHYPPSHYFGCRGASRRDLRMAVVIEKYTHLQINLVFTNDSTESLVYNILQLNVLHTGRLMFQGETGRGLSKSFQQPWCVEHPSSVYRTKEMQFKDENQNEQTCFAAETKRIQLHITDSRLTWNQAESLVGAVSRQLNVLHQAASGFSRYDIRDIAIHIYFCTALLISPRPVSPFHFGLIRLAQSIQSTQVQHIQLPGNITNERLSWVPGESLEKPNLFVNVCISLTSCNLVSVRTYGRRKLRDCAYVMSFKKGETVRGLPTNFQQPYEWYITNIHVSRHLEYHSD
ncbi:hypothetical protein T265_08150 [Opisthorchis viverrini]|uniref:Uncharacterized protein n=1 Tax=Opisthorchis viverrini TaxID=6198 RepID=A0A074ZAG9_OPIVI|nr:hypothetical protein T265_08150 [Opisthorchis viverrini]KER24108.1 hypothetical protein T265_08150 [Opisthorchis viverrini]